MRLAGLFGLRWARWRFAFQIWTAVCLALGVAFWLQLDGASSAGVCVAILALQTRGQVFEKAFYRMLGTIIGAIASIAITAIFSQMSDLYVVAYSVWLGICVFAAGFLDGNRAYAAVLCGYTVSIVAVAQIDDPNQVFFAAVDRGAAILIGIAAMSFVNMLFSAPYITLTLIDQVRAAQARVHIFTAAPLSLGSDEAHNAEAAQVLGEISERHQDINVLAVETLTGLSRGAAVRETVSALVGEVITARLLTAARVDRDDGLDEILSYGLQSDLETFRSQERCAIRALDCGNSSPGAPGMPIYRSWENAFRNGLRAFIASTLTGFGLAQCGWPASSLAWQFVGIVICLSATALDPRVLARAALIAMPAAAAVAGITLFGILDGSDAFPLLCAGIAPAVIGGALLLASPNPKFATVGSLLTVFTLVIIQPSNPQIYDPSSYAIMSMLMIIAIILVFLIVSILFPVTEANRRAWVLRSARVALAAALRGKTRQPEAEARFLDASRIATLSALTDMPATCRAADLAKMFWLTDLRATTQRVWVGFDRLRAEGALPSASLRTNTLAALTRMDAGLLRQAALALVASRENSAHAVAGHIALAARLIELAPRRNYSANALR